MAKKSSNRRRQRKKILNLNSFDPNSSTSKALMNPLILNLIFYQLDFHDLKESRLVCREWCDVGTNLLGKRSLLRLLNPDKSFHVDENLTRQILLYCESPNDIFHQIDMLKSTKIEHVTVLIYDDVNKNVAPSYQNFPTQATLSSIKFELARYINREKFDLYQAYQVALKVLIDASPNLTSLDVSGSFLPNLENVRNLEFLKLSFVKCTNSCCPNFDAAAITTMMTHVKDSIVDLELCYVGGKCSDMAQVSNFPVMPKLVSLTIYPINLFLPQHDFFDEEHLPKLKHLSIKNHFFSDSELSSYINLWKRHSGVQSLVLTMNWPWMGEHLQENLVQLFPSVKKFDLTMDLNGATSIGQVTKVMEPFNIWDLNETSLSVSWVYEASLLVAILKNMAGWKGVKSLNFKNVQVTDEDLVSFNEEIAPYKKGFKAIACNFSSIHG